LIPKFHFIVIELEGNTFLVNAVSPSLGLDIANKAPLRIRSGDSNNLPQSTLSEIKTYSTQ